MLDLRKQLTGKHMPKPANVRLCAGYWSTFASNEQDPINRASSYKGSGHN